MAKQVQFRRGTATENNAFTGAVGEISVDTTNKQLRVHDGSTAGGTAALAGLPANNAVIDTEQTFTAPQRGATTALTSATTITIDLDNNNFYSVTLAHSTTFANPTNTTAGQAGSIFITQDGSGSRTASWGSNWKFAGGTAPTLTTTAAAVDRIDYVVKSATEIHAVATLALATAV